MANDVLVKEECSAYVMCCDVIFWIALMFSLRGLRFGMPLQGTSFTCLIE